MIYALPMPTEKFEDVISGRKNFLIATDDLDYVIGDLIAINEFDDSKNFTGRSCLVLIDYILDEDKWFKEGYIGIGIKPCYVGITTGYDNEYNRNPFAVPVIWRKER